MTSRSSGSVRSVTLNLDGPGKLRACALAKSLAKRLGVSWAFNPHLTIQAIFNFSERERIVEALADISLSVPPIRLTVVDAGILRSPTDQTRLHLHCRVARTPVLVNLQRTVTERLAALDAKTYDFSSDEWIPHVTLVAGHFSEDELTPLISDVEVGMKGAFFAARSIALSRRIPSGSWQLEAQFPLEGRHARGGKRTG